MLRQVKKTKTYNNKDPYDGKWGLDGDVPWPLNVDGKTACWVASTKVLKMLATEWWHCKH